MENILIIEDSKAIADYTASIISKENYFVTISYSGRDAIQKISQNQYHLILLDLVLPDFDGVDILTQIREEYSPEQLPVIIISSVNEEKSIASILEQGANDFLTKPFAELVLRVKVKNLIELQLKVQEVKEAKDLYQEQSEELKQLLEIQNQTNQLLTKSENKYKKLSTNLQILNKKHKEINDKLKITNNLLNDQNDDLKLYKSMIENSGDPVFMIDDDTLKMIYVNEAAQKHYNAPLEEIYSWSVPDWDPNFTHENAKELLDPVLKQEHVTLESHHKIKNGETVQVEISVNQIDYKGKTCHYGYFQNIEERKKHERKLEDLNATKDKLFSIIAHDLKSPFNAILGFSDLLLDNIENFDTSKIKQFITSINDAGKNTFALLENLLQWARSQSGSLKFEPENLILEDVVKEVVVATSSNASMKHIRVITDITANEIFADRNMLHAVLRNLMTNAIKYTNRKGEIKIYSERFENQVKITVQDNGVGMNEEIMENLFVLSGKHSENGTEQEKGTGLGLILCKDFVEQHGGNIWAESEEGKGSKFIFTMEIWKP